MVTLSRHNNTDRQTQLPLVRTQTDPFLVGTSAHRYGTFISHNDRHTDRATLSMHTDRPIFSRYTHTHTHTHTHTQPSSVCVSTHRHGYLQQA